MYSHPFITNITEVLVYSRYWSRNWGMEIGIEHEPDPRKVQGVLYNMEMRRYIYSNYALLLILSHFLTVSGGRKKSRHKERNQRQLSHYLEHCAYISAGFQSLGNKLKG